MTKRLFLFVGVVIGFLFAEILRRKKMKRLATLEAKEAKRQADYARYEREWQEELAMMPFNERMDYELWEAGMRLNHWMPDIEEWEDDDAEET